MPSHFFSGVNGMPNATHILYQASNHVIGPPLWHIDYDDFDIDASGIATSYTETATGAGTSVLTAGDGGLLLLTNAAADNDALFLQRPTAGWLLDTAKDCYFGMRFQISDATQSDFICGLQADDTTPLDVTDGIYFIKADGATTVDLVLEKVSSQTVVSAVHTMVAATFVELAWYYSANDQKIYAGVNGQVVAGTSTLTNFPNTVNLVPSFGIQNGEAVAKTMTVDYWYAGKAR